MEFVTALTPPPQAVASRAEQRGYAALDRFAPLLTEFGAGIGAAHA